VTLITSHNRLLPRDALSASRILGEVFEAEGIKVLHNAPAERVRRKDDGLHMLANWQEVIGDVLLIAAGRRSNVDDLDLEKAGVVYSPAGIQVDENLRTSQSHIYAVGDCTGGPQFTHYAGWQAAIAVRNALLPGSSKGVTNLVPWTTFTDPEVAHVGLTEEQARNEFGDGVMVCEWPMAQVDRARAEGDTAGFIKLVHKQDGTLLGATAVARRAGEMIHEWIVALDQGLKVGELAGAIHVYPTYSMAGMQASVEIRLAKLLGGQTGRIMRGLARLKR
jgi:pyruvate/2-oxoglutarate dehydrogenase complex dihydrolipoamide dehydrogenase (E3) component